LNTVLALFYLDDGDLSLPKASSGVTGYSGCDTGTPMVEFLTKLVLVVRSRLKSRARLEAKNIVLPQQVIVLGRKPRSRVRLVFQPWDGTRRILTMNLPTV
jgi:hypothetical protein